MAEPAAAVKPEPLPDDAGAVMRARAHVEIVRRRVVHEIGHLRGMTEQAGADVAKDRASALWQFGRSRFA